MATLTAPNSAQGPEPGLLTLTAAQTGIGDSQNVADRGDSLAAAMLQIIATVGATPTVTVALMGSIDNVNWFAVPYADIATPGTVSVATFTITAAGTFYKVLQANSPWRYLKVTLSANTNVTITSETLAVY